jgi:hypothetical protein
MSNPVSYFGAQINQLPAPTNIPSSTPPTFAGITSNTPNSDGSVTLNWSAATFVVTPGQYLLYIALGSVSAATLFALAPASIAPAGNTSFKVFTLNDEATYLVNGNTYTVGVRAKDAVGNIDSNTVIETFAATASGNIGGVMQATAASLAATQTSFAASLVTMNSYLGTLNGYLTTFSGDLTVLATDLTNFASYNATYTSQNSTFNGYLGTLASDLTTLATDLTNFNSYNSVYTANNSTFTSSLVTLASDLTAFAGYLTTLGADVTAINAVLATLEALVAGLQVSIGGIPIIGILEVLNQEVPNMNPSIPPVNSQAIIIQGSIATLLVRIVNAVTGDPYDLTAVSQVSTCFYNADGSELMLNLSSGVSILGATIGKIQIGLTAAQTALLNIVQYATLEVSLTTGSGVIKVQIPQAYNVVASVC